MGWYRCTGGSSGGTEDGFVIELFSNGEWKNSDIINHTLSATGAEWLAIEDGCLIYKDSPTGVSFNIVDTTKKFYLFIEFTATISSVYCQSGRCVIGADARLCQNTGSGRYSYHDMYNISNTKTYMLNNFLNQFNQGLFFSGNNISISKIYAKVVDDDTQRIYVD